MKKTVLKLFSEWKFIKYIVNVSCSYAHGDIAMKYARFFTRLVTLNEIGIYENYEKLIVDPFINGLFDKENEHTLWHKAMCGGTSITFLHEIAKPGVMDIDGVLPETNILHEMFEKLLERLQSYIPGLCEIIQSSDMKNKNKIKRRKRKKKKKRKMIQ